MRRRWKIWAMCTRSDPASRAWSTFGTQAIVNSGPSGCDPTSCGLIVPPPGRISTVRPIVLVVALRLRGVVAANCAWSSHCSWSWTVAGS